MLEVMAVTFDGAHTGERVLSALRATRDDPWLSEVSLIEHDRDGRYSVKAKNPAVGERHAGKGAAIGGLTGLFVGVIGGPLGLMLWSGVGALAGSAIGISKESAFLPIVDEFKARLAPDASMLVLVGETPALDDLGVAVADDDVSIHRQPLTSAQAKELSDAAAA